MPHLGAWENPFQGEPVRANPGMDFPMLLGEAWNVIPSKCHLPLNGYSLAHVLTYHGMDIHMLGDYLEYNITELLLFNKLVNTIFQHL